MSEQKRADFLRKSPLADVKSAKIWRKQKFHMEQAPGRGLINILENYSEWTIFSQRFDGKVGRIIKQMCKVKKKQTGQ